MGNSCAPQGVENEVRKQAQTGSRANSSDQSLRLNRKKSFRSQMFISNPKNRNVFDYYDVIEVIGEGSISTIYAVRRKPRADLLTLTSNFVLHIFNKKNDYAALQGLNRPRKLKTSYRHDLELKEHIYALKAIQKDQVSELFLKEMRNEISIVKHLDHPNIVKIFESFEHKRQIYLVMEYCSGGDLYERAPYPEPAAAQLMIKILSAVAYMHKNNVVHRDIKFENILFEDKAPDSEVKIIDFGLSKKYNMRHHQNSIIMTETVGTVYTMAPQVLQGVYTSKADIWAIGVITYMMLSGQKPFWGKKRRHIVDKIMRCDYNFDDEIWKTVSPKAKQFIAACLQMNPHHRPTAEDALKAEWLQGRESTGKVSTATMEGIRRNIIDYSKNNRFKKLALMVVAHRSSINEVMVLRNAFRKFDKDQDGVISFSEFKRVLAETDYTDEDLHNIFAQLDVNGTGVIDYTEFLAASLECQGRIEKERLAEAFDRFDADHTGFISAHNLDTVLGHRNKHLIHEMFQELGVDEGGEISYEAFLSLFDQKQSTEIEQKKSEIRCCDERRESDDALVEETVSIPGGKFQSNPALN